MRLIRLFFSLVLLTFAALCVLFALLNHEAATVDLLVDRVPVPVFVLVLVPLALGVLVGWFLAWLKGGRDRKAKRQEHRRVRDLEREVDTMKKRDTAPGTAPGTGPAPGPRPAPGLALSPPPREQRRSLTGPQATREPAAGAPSSVVGG